VPTNDQSSNNIFTNFFDTTIAPNIFPAVAAGFFNDGYDHMQPVPTVLDTTARITLNNAHRSSPLFLACNGYIRHVSCPDASTTVVYTTTDYIDEIEAALFFGPGGHDHFITSGGGGCAYMYGVLTEDYQGCVAFDRHQDSDNVGQFYQSSQRCYADSLFGTGTGRIASGEIVGDEVHLTGEEVTAAFNATTLMQVWSPDAPLQQFFRVLHKG
jgi:hypothetical protein